MTAVKQGRSPGPVVMRDWTYCLYSRAKAPVFEHPADGSPRLAQFDRALSRRRAKNKVARAARRANR